MPLNFFKSFKSIDSSASNSILGSESGRLDILEKTSFSIKGNDGEFDRLVGRLGFSGIEDFAIPADVWQARKMKQFYSPKSEEQEKSEVSEVSGMTELTGREDSGKGRERGGGGGGERMKGTTPPALKPPPSIRLPPIDPSCSTWDLFKDFGPIEKDSGDVPHGGFSSGDEAEEGGVNGKDLKDNKGRERGGGGNGIKGTRPPALKPPPSIMLPPIDLSCSTSCSFTTSNDDVSSSSTAEPLSNTSSRDRICRNITNWQKGDLLGRGTCGSVYEGISDDGFFFAVKEVSLLDRGAMGRQSILQLEKEIDLLSQLKDENIVRYYGTDKDDSKLYVFLELVTKGSLLKLYQNYKLRDSHVSAYTRQVLHGLKYLHNRNVIHRDIRCANLLVNTNGSVKLADFGLAKATKLNDVNQGSAFWMAPEVVRAKDHGYGLPADIWGLGCTVLEMLTGQLPYAPLECMQAFFRIGKGEPPPVPETLSNDARDFILKCVQVNPDDRPTAAQLLNHPFVRPLPTTLGSTSPYQLGRRIST